MALLERFTVEIYQVQHTPQDYINELIIGILNSPIASRINIELIFLSIRPISRILGKTNRFNIPTIDSLLLS